MGTPASKAAKIGYFTEALAKSAFIEIDGYIFRIAGFYEDELHFEDEESGEMYVNTLEELIEDMYEIKLLKLTPAWG